MPRQPAYPFEPKSNAYLTPGQFWAIPLSDGRFACGRVMEVPRDPDPWIAVSTRMFLAGLMDWAGEAEPDAAAIEGANVVRQGFAHILAIKKTGGQILGQRDLAADGLRPQLWLSASPWGRNVWVFEGARRVRPAEGDDLQLPVKSTWGYRFIGLLAERMFVLGDKRIP